MPLSIAIFMAVFVQTYSCWRIPMQPHGSYVQTLLRLWVTRSGRDNSGNSPVSNFHVDACTMINSAGALVRRQLAVYENESYCSLKQRYEVTYFRISGQKSPVLQMLVLRVAAQKTRMQITEVHSKSSSCCCLPFSGKRENSVKTAVKPYLFWSTSHCNFVQGCYFRTL